MNNLAIQEQLALLPPSPVETENKIDPALFTVDSESGFEMRESVEEHDAEPIKDIADVHRLYEYFLARRDYRMYLMLKIGFNSGLRVSDIRGMRLGDLIREDGTFYDEFVLIEQKTRNSRKDRRNRHIPIAEEIQSALRLYMEHSHGRLTLDSYLFTGTSNRSTGNPLSVRAINAIFAQAKLELGFDFRMSTHTMRKTFGYQFLKQHGFDPRYLMLLQQMFGHSKMENTLYYLGITADEIAESYKELRL